MPDTTETIRLRVRADVDDRDVLRYVQYSTEIPVSFVITDYTIPDGADARFYIRKPSGLEVYQECEIDGQRVILRPTTQTFAEYGWQSAQLQIAIEGRLLTSYLIRCNIERNIIADNAVESQSEFSVLDELIKQARAAISDSEAQTSAAKDATDAANQAKANADSAAQSAKETAEAAAQNASAAAEAATETAAAAKQTAEAAAQSATDAADEARAAASEAEQAKADTEAATKAANDLVDTVQGKLDAGEFIGPKGDAATVTVGQVATGDPGTDVIITNSGDEHAAILDFTIPRGDKGDTGSVGNLEGGTENNVLSCDAEGMAKWTGDLNIKTLTVAGVDMTITSEQYDALITLLGGGNG